MVHSTSLSWCRGWFWSPIEELQASAFWGRPNICCFCLDLHDMMKVRHILNDPCTSLRSHIPSHSNDRISDVQGTWTQAAHPLFPQFAVHSCCKLVHSSPISCPVASCLLGRSRTCATFQDHRDMMGRVCLRRCDHRNDTCCCWSWRHLSRRT